MYFSEKNLCLIFYNRCQICANLRCQHSWCLIYGNKAYYTNWKNAEQSEIYRQAPFKRKTLWFSHNEPPYCWKQSLTRILRIIRINLKKPPLITCTHNAWKQYCPSSIISWPNDNITRVKLQMKISVHWEFFYEAYTKVDFSFKHGQGIRKVSKKRQFQVRFLR